MVHLDITRAALQASLLGACAPCSCNSLARTQQARAASAPARTADGVRGSPASAPASIYRARVRRPRAHSDALRVCKPARASAHASTALASTAGEPDTRAASSGHGRILGQVQHAGPADAQRAQPYQFRARLARRARQARQARLLGRGATIARAIGRALAPTRTLRKHLLQARAWSPAST